jgi:hypothetical protein
MLKNVSTINFQVTRRGNVYKDNKQVYFYTANRLHFPCTPSDTGYIDKKYAFETANFLKKKASDKITYFQM